MAVHLRLRRMGAKKRPFYRIVAADSRRARDGRFLEIVGTYDPIKTPAEVKISEDKIAKWLDQGAVASDTVHSLLGQIGFNEKYELSKRGKETGEMEIKTTITERPKRTRKIKKAALAEEAEAKAQAEAAEKADEGEKPAEGGEAKEEAGGEETKE